MHTVDELHAAERIELAPELDHPARRIDPMVESDRPLLALEPALPLVVFEPALLVTDLSGELLRAHLARLERSSQRGRLLRRVLATQHPPRLLLRRLGCLRDGVLRQRAVRGHVASERDLSPGTPSLDRSKFRDRLRHLGPIARLVDRRDSAHQPRDFVDLQPHLPVRVNPRSPGEGDCHPPKGCDSPRIRVLSPR